MFYQCQRAVITGNVLHGDHRQCRDVLPMSASGDHWQCPAW
jgi:hypothetical protein